MPVLESPTAFQVEVPEGWTVIGIPGKEYTITPPGAPGLSVTITVFSPRPKGDSDPKVSTEAVRAFAKKVGMENPENLTVLTPKGQGRAFAAIPTKDRNWYVGFLFFKNAFVLANASAPTSDKNGIALGEQMIWTITSA